jgi:uncharacterized protein DUF6933
MLYLKCTNAVQRHVGLKKENLADAVSTDSILGNWYVNRFPLEERHALVFMSEATLLSFILFEGKRPVTVETIPDMFMAGLQQLLEMRGIGAQAINLIMKPYETGLYAKTDNRSDLGSLNDLVKGYQARIEYEGGLSRCDLTRIIMGTNEMPQRKLNWSTSWEVTKQRIALATTASPPGRH